MSTQSRPYFTFWTSVFWIICAFGLAATFLRFTQGLAGSTNLSDEFPWGIWIGFDVLCGVGLAAGGFVVAASVYIFNLEKYRPVLRPAILTAFLGYVLVIFSLLFDLGRPWNIWHPLIMWNPRSVMFEVGWCVMLYSAVLALEFSPMVFEKLNLTRPKRILGMITVPLVIAGVILSSLHQSSLGSLYLLVPGKLYPLWYSANLPYLFFISAVAVGPAMVTIESYYSARAFRRQIELPILSSLGKVTATALAVYLVLKVQDILAMNLVPIVFTFNLEGIMFWLEILIGSLIPIALLFSTRIRNSKHGLFTASLFVVFGFLLNRLNLSLTALQASSPVEYFPGIFEISVTLMVVALGFAAFRLAAKHLPVFPEEHVAPTGDNERDPVRFIDIPTTVSH